MRKNYFVSGIILLMTLSAVKAQFPTLKFANGIGSTTNEEGNSVVIDASGVSYTTGRFSGSADFDPSPSNFILNPVGNADIYVASYKNNGQYQWAFNIGGPNADQGTDIALSPSGDIYVVGNFSGIADFDPSPATATLSAPGFQSNAFLAKYSSNGVYQWAINIGTTAIELASGVCVDASGNIFLTGSFEGIVDFDPGIGVFNLTSLGGADVFIAKYSSAGNFIHAVAFGSVTNDVGNSICVDGTSNIYLCGNFTGSIDLDPGLANINFNSLGQEDIFVSKFSNALTFNWGFGMGSTLSDNCLALSFDSGCNSIYVGGDFFNTIDFNPGVATNNLTSSGSIDAFVANYDLNGNYQSAFKIGNPTSAESITDICSDNNCHFYITGAFSGLNTDFDPNTGITNLTTAGSNDIFIAKYAAGNNLQWAFSVGDFANDYAFGIATNNAGAISVTGQFFGNSCDFNPDTPVASLSNSGGTDIFLANYDVVTITDIETNTTKNKHPAIQLQNLGDVINVQSNNLYKVNIIDVSGKIVGEKEIVAGLNFIDITNLSNGLYIFNFSNSSETFFKKIIKQ